MKTFLVIDPKGIDLHSGKIALNAEQYGDRQHLVEKLSQQGFYEIVKPVFFKRGEIIGVDEKDLTRALSERLKPISDIESHIVLDGDDLSLLGIDGAPLSDDHLPDGEDLGGDDNSPTDEPAEAANPVEPVTETKPADEPAEAAKPAKSAKSAK